MRNVYGLNDVDRTRLILNQAKERDFVIIEGAQKMMWDNFTDCPKNVIILDDVETLDKNMF